MICPLEIARDLSAFRAGRVGDHRKPPTIHDKNYDLDYSAFPVSYQSLGAVGVVLETAAVKALDAVLVCD
jgi:hypothetical protein